MGSLDEAVLRIRAIPGYRSIFEGAFGNGEVVTMENAAMAIAAYERTLVTPNSQFDRYVSGDKTAMSGDAVRGMNTFEQGGCTSCHSGAVFAGPTLPPGTGLFMKFPMFADNQYVKAFGLDKDEGRYEATGVESDKNLWRVPTLRNLVYTAPYFHNGAVKTLAESVRIMAKTQLNKNLADTEVDDIVAFLESLTGEFPQQTMPRLPPTPGTLLE
jgi:cytochrome c peroxidase